MTAIERRIILLMDKYLSTIIFVLALFIGYSYRKALIGSVREAFKAGKKPEMRPKTAHDTKAIIIHSAFITNGNDIAKATI